MKNTHLELFEKLSRNCDGGPVKKAVLILSTPRSGSTMFCDVLTNSRHIGICDEWFNEEYWDAWQRVTGVKKFYIQDYLTWVTKKTVMDTGVWAVHLHVGQLVHISEKFDFDAGAMVFDYCAWVYRRDKIAQAASFAKAVSTDCFKSVETPKRKPDVSFRNIAKHLSVIIDHDQFYRQTLSKCFDAEFAYEDFCELPSGSESPFNHVMGGVNKPYIAQPVCSTKKQSTVNDTQIICNFRKHLLGA